jgi:hypothetical protein
MIATENNNEGNSCDLVYPIRRERNSETPHHVVYANFICFQITYQQPTCHKKSDSA